MTRHLKTASGARERSPSNIFDWWATMVRGKLLPAVAAVLATIASPLHAAVSVPQQPNILFILTDDMGYGDIGCYGG